MANCWSGPPTRPGRLGASCRRGPQQGQGTVAPPETHLRIGPSNGAKEVVGLGADESIGIILSFGYPTRGGDPERRSPEEWIEHANRRPFDEVVETI